MKNKCIRIFYIKQFFKSSRERTEMCYEKNNNVKWYVHKLFSNISIYSTKNKQHK